MEVDELKADGFPEVIGSGLYPWFWQYERLPLCFFVAKL